MPSFYALVGVPPTGFDPADTFTTSWLLPPMLLAALRALLSLYCFVAIFADWGWLATHHARAEIGQDFSYFTNLTYWGLAFYFAVAAAHTFVYAIRGQSWLARWPRPLQALHSLFYTTIVTYPFLVTIVFWAILYSPPWFPVEETAWSNISRHALNSLFAFLEIALPSTHPPPWLHLLFLILILLLYLALAFITYATQHFYVYSFLDTQTHSRGYVTGYCFGIFAAILVIFLVVWCLIWLRRRVTGTGKKSQRDKAESGPARYHQDAEMATVTKVY